MLAVLASAGLTAIGGAFGAGVIFVRNGMPGASLAMAVLTGMALLCYVGTLALASAAQRQVTPAQPMPAPAVPTPSRARAAYPAPWPTAPASGFPADEGWPIARPTKSPAAWSARK